MVPIQVIERELEARFPVFGPNKRRELVRLLFEISKREQVRPDVVLENIPAACRAYGAVKNCLLKRRFPDTFGRGDKISESFSAVDIVPAYAVDTSRLEKVPAPRHVYIEQGLEKFELVRRLEKRFSKARFTSIREYKQHVADLRPDIGAYNRRTEDLFIVLEKHGHLKPCPCSSGTVSCGYHNADLGFGCPFECSYCFLQNYTNAPGIVLPADLNGFFDSFRRYPQPVRVGSGQTTDSLVYDDLSCFSSGIVDFFRSFPESIFEFKTKSDNVGGLLSVKASSNIVAGWSVNPPHIIAREEFFTAGLDERLDAARRCAAHGYRTAFHFDPVIYEPGWEASYAKVIADIFRAVPAESIAWISIGTLRMTPAQKKTIENRFPKNTILNAELLTAEDGKLRYAHKVRLDICRKMMSLIREKAHSSTALYLCMETALIWKEVGIKFNARFKSEGMCAI